MPRNHPFHLPLFQLLQIVQPAGQVDLGKYAAGAGLVGLVGVAGALAAPLFGRHADRATPLAVNGLAIAVLLLGYGAFALGGGSLVGLAVGVVLLDLGAQANHISNQTRIFNLDPRRRSRLNTIYMSSYFGGGAAGSALGIAVYERWGWTGVCALGLGFGLAACKNPPTSAQVNADVAAGIGVLQGAATAYIDGQKCKADLPVIKGLTLQTALAVASDPACVAALNAAAGAGNAADAIVQAN